MVLCLKCFRLWKAGTRTCGTCHSSLGCRYCPDAHANPLVADCCTECGSPNLTAGVPCLNLRFLTYALILLVGYLCLPLAKDALGHLTDRWYGWFLREVVSRIAELCLLSWIIAWAFGPRATRAVGDFWNAMFGLVLQGIYALARALTRLFRA